MTKNQIIAKAMLTTLGIYAIVVFSTALLSNLFQIDGPWEIPMIVFLILVTIFFIGRFFIFSNDRLACKIAANSGSNDDFDRRSYLIKTFRIAFVILGLLLLSSPRTFTAITDFLQMLSLPQIRLWMRNFIADRQINLSGIFTFRLLEFLKLIIIAYLLCGGKLIIKRNLKNLILNNTNEELENE